MKSSNKTDNLDHCPCHQFQTIIFNWDADMEHLWCRHFPCPIFILLIRINCHKPTENCLKKKCYHLLFQTKGRAYVSETLCESNMTRKRRNKDDRIDRAVNLSVQLFNLDVLFLPKVKPPKWMFYCNEPTR